MHELTLYYSVQNCGDGSAYPKWMSSEKLAEYDQDHMDEGWGESCNGKVTLESDSPIKVKEKIETPEGYLINLIDNDRDTSEFIETFFPEGKPTFNVQIRETKGDKKYVYNDVFVNDLKVGSIFREREESGKPLEDLLNS